MPSIHFTLDPTDIEFSSMRAQGNGGQNVNKVSSAIHLRFNIHTSNLPTELKQRLQSLADQRITADGVIVIKAQEHRTQEKNRSDALVRLEALLAQAAHTPKSRKATKPTRSSKERRLAGKSKRSEIKKMRKV